MAKLTTAKTAKEDMKIAIQFSIFLINKPGILAQVLNALAEKKINIVAMTMMDSVEHGVLRLVAQDPDKAREILKTQSLQISESDVLCVTLPNKPGALSEIAAKLSKNHININYCYVTTGGRGGKTNGVLRVADQKKAMKILTTKATTSIRKKTRKTVKTKTSSKRGK